MIVEIALAFALVIFTICVFLVVFIGGGLLIGLR